MDAIHPLLCGFEPEKLICLDAEFADGAYMLELSIADANGKLIYCQRFKPAKISTWEAYPHGITPEMVDSEPAFADCIPAIQQIIDTADYITGFAIGNDFRRLKSEGINIPDNKAIIELRDWFWTLYGLAHGLDLTQGISNQSVAEKLGIQVDETRLHGSEYDIELSLSSLNRLLSAATLPEAADFNELYRKVSEKFTADKEQYDREHSAGFCYIQKRDNGYLVKCSRSKPANGKSLLACIEVENRKEALIHMSQLFLNRITEGSFMVDKVSNAKLDKFKAYSNTFSADNTSMYSKLMRLAGKFNR